MKRTLLLSVLTLGLASSGLAQDDTLEQPEEKIFVVVEQMPSWPGCEKEETLQEIDVCTDQNMLKFLANHLTLPDSISDAECFFGRITAKFIIDRNGAVTSIGRIGNVSDQCNQAVVDVIRRFPLWNPGEHGGEKVPVQIMIPIQLEP